MKTMGGFQRSRYRGLERTLLAGYLVAAAYNLVRTARLVTAQPAAASPSDRRRLSGTHSHSDP